MSPKAKTKEFIATGRRKTSTARVRITEGKGAFPSNTRDLSVYCKTELHWTRAPSPRTTGEHA
ncbi:MAG: 30S ribosomal protein S9, partial [Verrucomicrobiota bacterium]